MTLRRWARCTGEAGDAAGSTGRGGSHGGGPGARAAASETQGFVTESQECASTRGTADSRVTSGGSGVASFLLNKVFLADIENGLQEFKGEDGVPQLHTFQRPPGKGGRD